MLDEPDSESHRTSSPWDSLASSPSPTQRGIPRLPPEVEEGNVEYKLQLLSPSRARFARLVTQLKWRLLAGGGQAFYELGVADSGTLVGLQRQQLEQSLETLEMMAGEIGACVTVVKEVQVPPELSRLAESQLERWDGKRSARRKDFLRKDPSHSMPGTGSEIELSLNATDSDDPTERSQSIIPPAPLTVQPISNSESTRSSPDPFPFDPALAMFTMDVGEDISNDADNEAQDGDTSAGSGAEITTGLEILSVYKPRSMKKRATHTKFLSTSSQWTKKGYKNGYSPVKSIHTVCPTRDPMALETSPRLNTTVYRPKRDERWELKLGGLLNRLSAIDLVHNTKTLSMNSHLVNESTHASLESPHTVVDPPNSTISETSTSQEPRIIVEALVFKEPLLDEVFLDLEELSLQ